MDRPGSPRFGRLGQRKINFYSNSIISSTGRVLVSLGQAGTPDRVEVSPRPNLVQEHLARFKASLQDSDFSAVNNARKKIGKSIPSSSVDIEPQLRAMGAINQERMAVDSSSVLGPRPSWEDARPHPPAPPLVQGEYIAKLDRSFHRPRVGSNAARIALLSQLGGSANELRNLGRGVPPTNVLWADIAELRGSRRLRQYIAEHKRDGETPLELLTDFAYEWEELRRRQRERQRQQLQDVTSSVTGSSCNTVGALTSPALATSTTVVSVQQQQEQQQLQQHHQHQQLQLQLPQPQPVVYVAESDWPAAAAAVAAAAAAAIGASVSLSASVSAAPLLGSQPSSATNSNGSVTRLVDGTAKPAPTSVVLVHFPPKPTDVGMVADTVAATPAALTKAAASIGVPPSPSPPATLPPRMPRRTSSLQAPSVTDVMPSISVSISPFRKFSSCGSETSTAAAALAAGFVPSLERYHTTYTLPSRALTTGADKLSPRTLVSATRLVEVVEVVQPPRMRPHFRMSDSSGGGGGGGEGSVACAAALQPLIRRHSVADLASWDAGLRTNGGGSGGVGTKAAEAADSRKLAAGPAIPVAAWAAAATTVTATKDPSVDADADNDGSSSQASSPRLSTFDAAASVVMQAQRWKRLAASPAAGTQIGPGDFAHMAAVTEEAVPARTLGLVPALATSASQIVVLASTPHLPPPSGTTTRPPAVAAPGPLETKRMKAQTVAQLEKRWSITGRAAVAAAATAATAAMVPSSSLRLPFLRAASSHSGVSSSITMSGALPLKNGLAPPPEIADTVFLTQSCGTGITGAGTMDVIHEGPTEGGEEEPAGDAQPQLCPSLNADRRAVRVYDRGLEKQATLMPGLQVAGLPPRPPQGALRSRSLSVIPLTSSTSSINSTVPTGAQLRASISFGAGRHVRVKACPSPAAAEAEATVRPAAGAIAGPLSVTAVPPTGNDVTNNGGQTRQQSIRRLLNDQVRLATMVYGSDSKGERDVGERLQGSSSTQPRGNSVEELREMHLTPPPSLPPLPTRQQQVEALSDLVTDAESSVELREEQQPSKAVSDLPPLELQSMEEPHVPSVPSRHVTPQHGYGQGLLRHSLGAFGAGTAASGSVRTSFSGSAAGGGLAASITDHSTDLSCFQGDNRCCTQSSFFTGDSSVAPSEAGLTSASPSAEPSWAPAPGPVSRISSASSTASSRNRGNHALAPETAPEALGSVAVRVPVAEDKPTVLTLSSGMVSTAAVIEMPSLQVAVISRMDKPIVKSGAAGTSVASRAPDRQSPVQLLAHPQEQFITKRSGGGFVLIGARSGAVAPIRPMARKAAPPVAATTAALRGGKKMVATRIYVEVHAEPADAGAASPAKEEALGAGGFAGIAQVSTAQAAQGHPSVGSLNGAVSGSESHIVTMVY